MSEIDAAAEAAYLTDQPRPSWPALLARYQAESLRVLAGPGVMRDIAYGPQRRQVYDLVPAAGAPRGVVAYLHAGYWQSRDKAEFAFLAPAFTAMGCAVVMANYPLCPNVSVPALTEAARALVPALMERFGTLPIVAVGHSAGAHLAVELAMTDWAGRGLPAAPVAGLIGLSGVYDLRPLVATSLNVRLGLDAATARAASPVRRVGPRGCPALFVVGGGETVAFLDQSRRMAAAWGDAGHRGQLEIVGEADHFSLLAELADPAGWLHAAATALVAGVL
jgi:arylformamidase